MGLRGVGAWGRGRGREGGGELRVGGEREEEGIFVDVVDLRLFVTYMDVKKNISGSTNV